MGAFYDVESIKILENESFTTIDLLQIYWCPVNALSGQRLGNCIIKEIVKCALGRQSLFGQEVLIRLIDRLKHALGDEAHFCRLVAAAVRVNH